MSKFEETKYKIKKLFGNREGFTDEVFNSITASYLFFFKNHNDLINNDEILDVNKFKIPSSHSGKRTLANIYLNRIFNNVKSIEYTLNESRFSSGEDKVYIATGDLDRRLKYWSDDVVTGHEEEIKNQIKAKVLTHKLIHAASYNGVFVGFSSYFESSDISTKMWALNKNNKEKYNNMNAQASRLEEAITEILALNIVGSSIVNSGYQKSGFVVCRNPDSSNHNLNAFAEYFIRVYPDCINGKLTDGWAWNNKFEKEHSGQNPNFIIIRLNDNLRAFLKQNINVVEGISYYQKHMLVDYLKNLKVEKVEDLEKLVKDYAAFKLFVARDRNNQVDKELHHCLEEVHAKILEYTKMLGANKNKINQVYAKEKNRLRSIGENRQIAYPKPYEEILNYYGNEKDLNLG